MSCQSDDRIETLFDSTVRPSPLPGDLPAPSRRPPWLFDIGVKLAQQRLAEHWFVRVAVAIAARSPGALIFPSLPPGGLPGAALGAT